MTDQDIMNCTSPEKIWKKISNKASEGKARILPKTYGFLQSIFALWRSVATLLRFTQPIQDVGISKFKRESSKEECACILLCLALV